MAMVLRARHGQRVRATHQRSEPSLPRSARSAPGVHFATSTDEARPSPEPNPTPTSSLSTRVCAPPRFRGEPEVAEPPRRAPLTRRRTPALIRASPARPHATPEASSPVPSTRERSPGIWSRPPWPAAGGVHPEDPALFTSVHRVVGHHELAQGRRRPHDGVYD